MSLNLRALFVLGLALCGCGDHYEGGGRRKELPMNDQTETEPPNIGPGDGSSAATGGAGTDGNAGAAGSE